MMELDGQNFDQNIEVHKRLAPAQVREPDAARAAADRLSGAQVIEESPFVQA